MKRSTNLTMALVSTLVWLTSSCIHAQPKFPDTDIVYQAGTLNDAQIAFVDADGSNNVVLSVDPYMAKPIWAPDGKTLYTLQWSGVGVSAGRVSVWREGKAIHVCRNDRWMAVEAVAVMPRSGSAQAIINNARKQLLLIDLDRCRELKRYIDYAKEPSREVWGASLSSDGKRFLYGESYNWPRHTKYVIMMMDVDTGESGEAIGEGINPAWSPDDKWIAYVQFDGIYIMAFDGSQSRQVIPYDATHGSGDTFAPREPSPHWSPDGQWLVYHKCVKYKLPCGIFKVEVATGAEVKIGDGDYPYWRSR